MLTLSYIVYFLLGREKKLLYDFVTCFNIALKMKNYIRQFRDTLLMTQHNTYCTIYMWERKTSFTRSHTTRHSKRVFVKAYVAVYAE